MSGVTKLLEWFQLSKSLLKCRLLMFKLKRIRIFLCEHLYINVSVLSSTVMCVASFSLFI